MGKKESHEEAELHRLQEWLRSAGGGISLGHSNLISFETSKRAKRLTIVLEKEVLEKEKASADEPPLIAPDEGPWELEGGFRFNKNEGRTRRSMSGIACPPNAPEPRLCLAVFDEGGEARRLAMTASGCSTDNERVVLLAGNRELDAEGAATDGRYYYVTGSHCANNPDSAHVIRFPVSPAHPGSTSSRDSEIADMIDTAALRGIIQGMPGLKEYAGDPGQAGSDSTLGGGVNIEGLAIRNGRLFFGFRNPCAQGAAKILSVDADRLFSGADADPKLFTLMLRSGQAVRDLEAVSDGILVLAGPDEAETSKNAGWTVSRWDDRSPAEGIIQAKTLACLNLQGVKLRPFDRKIKPEALTAVQDVPGEPYRIVIFSDGMCDGGPLVFTIPR